MTSLAELSTTPKFKRKDKFIRIKFGYSAILILPYDEGLAVLSLIKNAEVEDYVTTIGSVIIGELAEGNLEVSVLSKDTYIKKKAANLLKIPFDKIKDMEMDDEIPDYPERDSEECN